MIVLSDGRSHVTLLERWYAVLEDIASMLDIIPCFLRTRLFIRLDRRLDNSIDRDRYGSGFDGGEIHFVIFEYQRADCV